MSWLNDVDVFVQVVESGSFTHAAKTLELSKSVVSKYVSRLETELGVRLLHRTTRTLRLTEAGEIFLERSRIGLREIRGARSEILWMQGEPRGTLRVAAPVSFGILHLAPLLTSFMTRHPKVVVDVVMDDRKVDMLKEGIDLAIRVAPQLPESTLVARRIAPARHVICAAPAYLARHGEPSSPTDLVAHKVLAYHYQSSALEWDLRSQDGQAVSIAVTASARVNNSLAIREMLLAGGGIARTPTFVVGPDLRAGRLRAVLPAFRSPTSSIFVIYPAREFLSPKVRVFADFLIEHISETPEWDR